MAKLPRSDYAPKTELTDAEFHELHARLDRTRRTSTTISVDRQALTRLLADLGRLYAALDAIETGTRHAQSQAPHRPDDH